MALITLLLGENNFVMRGKKSLYSTKVISGDVQVEIMENFFTERVLKNRNGLPRAVVKSPRLEVLKK